MESFRGDSNAIFSEGEFLRLFSSLFLHAHLKHLISNAILFLFFSYLLFGYFGFWIYPVLCIFLGGLVNYFTLMIYPDGVSIIGSSGVIYLMAGFWFTCYICIERSRSISKRLLHVTGVSLILLIPSAVSPEVSYSSHVIGFGLGVAAGSVYYFKNKSDLRAREIIISDSEEDGPIQDNHVGDEEDSTRRNQPPWVM